MKGAYNGPARTRSISLIAEREVDQTYLLGIETLKCMSLFLPVRRTHCPTHELAVQALGTLITRGQGTTRQCWWRRR